MIIIFSRPIRSGKTTELMNFCKTAKDVGGILMPDKGEEKQFYDIASKEYFPASASPNDDEASVISVGAFKFSRDAFDKACGILDSSADRLVIVDEAGKLELAGDGFHRTIVKLVGERSMDEKKDLLLVVRDYLVEQVIEKYGLQKAVVVEELSEL
jgi:nucleoside-triphosphatase